MSIVKCSYCDKNIDLDFEDADYENGWFHVDCKIKHDEEEANGIKPYSKKSN